MLRRQTIEGTIIEVSQTQAEATQGITNDSLWAKVVNKVAISSFREHRDNIRRKRINENQSYDKLIQYAHDYQRSHRLEEYVAHKLRQLGLNAVAIPAKADGDTKAKQADIIITTEAGQKLAIEVKEARHPCTALGLPLTNGDDGFASYPKRLNVDSCYGYDCKERACYRRGEVLLGAIVLCPIARLSDDEFTVLGCVYLPVDDWTIKTTGRDGKVYDAYVADQTQMFTLADLVAEVQTYV